MDEGRAVPFGAWKTWTIDYFTWLYIGSVDAWLVFVVAVYFSKYGNLKLGKPDEKPEFSDLSWFVMLFACGVGIGMFFYGVAEAVVMNLRFELCMQFPLASICISQFT